MSSFAFIAVLLCAASLFGFINYRFLHLPSAIGLLVVSLVVSLGLIGLDAVLPGVNLIRWPQAVLQSKDLPRLLLNGALAFLLFPGAMHVDLDRLRSRQWTVLALATLGVVIATVLFGTGIWFVFNLVGQHVPYSWCLVLGAVLAPTDPVAVAALIGRVGLPPTLEAVISGESLFNDGVGVVLFSVALQVAAQGTPIGPGGVLLDFVREAAGGFALGLATGSVAFLAMRAVDEFRLEIMISLALAAGTYASANALGVSGPIAVVVAGLLIGSAGTRYAMSATTQTHMGAFWSIVDELLNALLFLLIGVAVISVQFHIDRLLAALLAIPLALAVRVVSVVVPTLLLHLHTPNKLGAVAVLTWGGLRGGISVALALILPQTEWRPQILAVCYGVVVFTIVVQGLTVERVIRRFYGARQEAAAEP